MKQYNLNETDIKILYGPVKTGHLIGSSAWSADGIGTIYTIPLENIVSIERTDNSDETFLVTVKKGDKTIEYGLYDFVTV